MAVLTIRPADASFLPEVTDGARKLKLAKFIPDYSFKEAGGNSVMIFDDFQCETVNDNPTYYVRSTTYKRPQMLPSGVTVNFRFIDRGGFEIYTVDTGTFEVTYMNGIRDPGPFFINAGVYKDSVLLRVTLDGGVWT